MGKTKKTVGTAFNLDAAEGSWFEFFTSRIDDQGDTVYDEPIPGAGKVCIRTAQPFVEEHVAKRRKKEIFKLNPKTRSMERVSYYEDLTMDETKQYSEDLHDYIITGLENINDANGTPIECTRENKIRLMKLPVFDRFVNKCLKTLGEESVVHTGKLNENL